MIEHDSRQQVQDALARVEREAGRVCRLLSMTNEWGNARTHAHEDPDIAVADYRVTVHGPTPDAEMIATITQVLAKHGWCGAVTSRGEVVRVDCGRGTLRLRLSAGQGVVTLSVSEALTIGRFAVRRILTGITLVRPGEDDQLDSAALEQTAIGA